MNITPCPFCGDGDPAHDEVAPGVNVLVCGACGAMGPFDPEVPQTPEQAMEAWNRRA